MLGLHISQKLHSSSEGNSFSPLWAFADTAALQEPARCPVGPCRQSLLVLGDGYEDEGSVPEPGA